MKILYFERTKNPLFWAVVVALAIILGGAIYSATTWNAQDESAGNGQHGAVNQIPDQTKMVQSIQAQPDTNNALKSSSSVQLQPAAGSATTQTAQPQSVGSVNDYYYPRDPNYCRLGRETMCVAPQP